MDITIKNGRPTMRDATTGALLLDDRGVPLFDTKGLNGAIIPDVRIDAQPAGFDIAYTFHNRGDAPAPMATLKLGILTLGDDAIYQDVRLAQQPVAAPPAAFPARSLDYPGAMYSPVTVFRNRTHAIGVSLQYPILDYQHDLRITLRSPGGRPAKGDGGRGFQVEHALSAPAPRVQPADPAMTGESGEPGESGKTGTSGQPQASRVRGPWPARPGLIGPGQERVYTVSVRITRSPDEWVRTLVPYRDYFRRLYGGVNYERHTGAINGVVMANIGRVSAQNPYGWAGAVPRPDQAGYKPWADEVKSRRGWSAFMLWMPSGMYDKTSIPMSVPFQFATRWTTDPRLASALDRTSGLASIPASGAELGLWFSRSLEVADTWNDEHRTALDPADPALTAAVFAELDAASAAGATIIGLDTFNPVIAPAWHLYPWLRRLCEKYPRITFATEPITFDLLHSLAPTYLRGYDDKAKPDRLEDLYKIQGPLILADFLLPGHETWAAMRYAGFRFFDAKVTPEIIAADAQRFAAWGFRPLLIVDGDLSRPAPAAESWRTSIPPDLQLPAGPSAR